MQQFSFNPAGILRKSTKAKKKNPRNPLALGFIIESPLQKGMSFTLLQIRINGNLNPRLT